MPKRTQDEARRENRKPLHEVDPPEDALPSLAGLGFCIHIHVRPERAKVAHGPQEEGAAGQHD
jgi:hypothetical protein